MSGNAYQRRSFKLKVRLAVAGDVINVESALRKFSVTDLDVP